MHHSGRWSCDLKGWMECGLVTEPLRDERGHIYIHTHGLSIAADTQTFSSAIETKQKPKITTTNEPNRQILPSLPTKI